MMNFARFIPGTPDADYMRQQVSERGILGKIDAVNETIKRCVGEDHSASEIADFYKMITDIEHSLDQNMNDPRAKKLVNTFDEAPKAEMKKETQETPETTKPEAPDTTDPNEGVDAGTDIGTVDPAENTGVTDPAEGDETINAGITDNPVSEGVSEGVQESTGPDTTEPEPTEPETKQPTRRGRKKSEDAE